MIYIDTNRCTGCGQCMEVCPTEAIRIVAGKATVSPDDCEECEACMDVCPEGAIMSVTQPVTQDQPVPFQPGIVQPKAYAGVQTAAVARSARWLPWLGAAAVLVRREVVPRLLDVLLDAWDQRTERQTASAVDTVLPGRRSRTSTRSILPRRGGHRHQWGRRGRK